MKHKYYLRAKSSDDLVELKNHLLNNGYNSTIEEQFLGQSRTADLFVDLLELSEVNTILKDRNISFVNAENLISEAIKEIMKRIADGTIPTCDDKLEEGDNLTSFVTRWSYYERHWDSYGLRETKESFIALLNMLQANNENLDSLHNVAFNGYEEFMGIYGTFDDDKDVAQAVIEFNIFFSSINDLADRTAENAFYEGTTIEEELDSCELYKTHTGFVDRLHY